MSLPLSDEATDRVARAGLPMVLVDTVHPSFTSVVTDDDWSRVAGLPVDALNALLAVVTAVAVVAAMRIVGILLVAAMMVLPVATAQLLARSFAGTLRIAIAVGVVTSIVGQSISVQAAWTSSSAPATT